MNTAKDYSPNVVTLIDRGILGLMSIRHDCLGNGLCGWRGWNVGMLTRGNLEVLMNALKNHDGARIAFSGSYRPRLQIAVVDGQESEIFSLSLATWEGVVTHVASHAHDLLAPNSCKPLPLVGRDTS